MGSTSSGKSLAANNLNQHEYRSQERALQPSLEPTWRVQSAERGSQHSSTGRRVMPHHRTSESKNDSDDRQLETSSVIDREVSQTYCFISTFSLRSHLFLMCKVGHMTHKLRA